MKIEKNSIKNLNYKKLIIILITVIFVILLIVGISKLFSKSSKLNFSDFEKVAIYGYLENNLLDVEKIYQLSGKSEYNELQIFQSKLKQALDLYFSTHSEKNVSSSTVLSLIDSKYVPENVDFHGILVSDYEYQPETDTFILSRGANSSIAGIEADINSIDYSDQKASVQNIEETEKNKYKVSFNIVNSMIDNDFAEATGEAILLLKDDEIVIESCTLND